MLRLALYLVVLGALSVGFYYLVQYLVARFEFSGGFTTTVYLVVFVTTLLANASIILPVAVHISIMIAAASQWSPLLIALVAATGGALGEITGYYAGYLGKRIVIAERVPGYRRLVDWMTRYGPLAVFLLSLQPILPVDIAGLVSGASRIPLWRFLLPCWAGKLLKYATLCYFGAGVLRLLTTGC